MSHDAGMFHDTAPVGKFKAFSCNRRQIQFKDHFCAPLAQVSRGTVCPVAGDNKMMSGSKLSSVLPNASSHTKYFHWAARGSVEFY